MVKCIYCDFDNSNHRGADFYFGKIIDVNKALNEVDGTEYQFLELHLSEKYPVLRFIHSDPDGWSNEDDEVCICMYCPMCGRYLGNEIKEYRGKLNENDRQN